MWESSGDIRSDDDEPSEGVLPGLLSPRSLRRTGRWDGLCSEHGSCVRFLWRGEAALGDGYRGIGCGFG